MKANKNRHEWSIGIVPLGTGVWSRLDLVMISTRAGV